MRILDLCSDYAIPSPNLLVPKREDEDIVMSESEGETTASAFSDEPVSQQSLAGSTQSPMLVAEATVPAETSMLHDYEEDGEGEDGEKGGKGEEDGEIHVAGYPGSGYPLSGDPERLSSPARPAPAPTPLRTASVPPLPIPTPKVTTEHDHHELTKDISRVSDGSLHGDRHRFNTPARGRDVDAESLSVHAHEVIDLTGEISVNIVAGTEAATMEFLLPSDADDSEEVPMKCKVTVMTKGPGSFSLAGSWRVGASTNKTS